MALAMDDIMERVPIAHTCGLFRWATIRCIIAVARYGCILMTSNGSITPLDTSGFITDYEQSELLVSRVTWTDLHDSLQELLKVSNVIRHLDDMLFDLLFKYIYYKTPLESATRKTNFLVHIFSKIETSFVSDLNPTDMQRVYDRLDRRGSASGGRSKRKYSKVWVLRHKEANNLRIRIIACPLVCLVCIL